jgi:hypothetical protein
LAIGQLKFKDMSNLSTLPKGDSAWLLRKAIQRVMQQVSVLETNIGASTTGNSANSQVIFNDNGILRGDPDLIFNTALNKLVVTNLEATAALTVGTTATITGNLTVDTNTLFVDAANNRVGIGTASPGFPLDIIGASGVGVRIYESSTGNNNRLQITQEGTETRFNSTYASGSAFYTWQIAGSEQMRLNSTGLGVGVTPTYRLQASVNSGADRDIFSAQVSGATNGFTIKWNHATTTLRVNFANALPTSSAGLASGDVWVDTSAGNVLKVV